MSRYSKWICLISVVLLLTACFSKLSNYFNVSKKAANQFRVVTYNINWGESNWPILAPQTTLRAINNIKGDLLLLQEATPYWMHYFKEHLISTYPYQLFKPKGNGGGLAILSKYPVTTKQYNHSSMGWHPGWIVDVKSPLGLMQVANLHLSPPLISKANVSFSLSNYFADPEIHEKEVHFYYQYIKRNLPTVIAGDFNEGDNGFVSQYLNQQGFIDAKPKSGMHLSTWSWKLGMFTLGGKLDHIFYNQWLTATKVQVLYDGDSDHYPFFVDLKRSPSHPE